MSAAALGKALATLIWKGLRRIVERLGRWVIRSLAEHGARALAAYMRVRVGVFKKRLARVLARKRHPEWRVRFLRGRISRWLAGARWLDARATELAGIAERTIAPYIEDLPEDAPWENEAAWRRLAR